MDTAENPQNHGNEGFGVFQKYGSLFLFYRSKFLHGNNFLHCWSNFVYYWSNLCKIDTVNLRNNMCEFSYPRTKRKRMEIGAHFLSWVTEDLPQFHASDP